MAIANGTVSFQSNRFLQQFEMDLGILPMYLASTNDWVLLHNLPSNEFLSKLEKDGFQLPSFKEIDVLLKDTMAGNDDFCEVRPWGWSPAFIHKTRSLIDRCSSSFKEDTTRFLCRDERQFYSRHFSLVVLKEVLENVNLNYLISEDELPIVCHSVDEIEVLHRKNKQSVLKAPWSSSGRGVNILRLPELNDSVRNRTNGVINSQGSIMYEPFLNKLIDFSFQFKIDDNQVHYLGLTFFNTDKKGQYKGHYLQNNPIGIESENYKFVKLYECQISEQLNTILSNKLLGKYIGYLGIDAMLVTIDNNLKIQPCVEINLRYNMGVLAMKIAEKIGQQYQQFKISTIEDIPDDKDILNLTEVSPKSVYAAYLVR